MRLIITVLLVTICTLAYSQPRKIRGTSQIENINPNQITASGAATNDLLRYNGTAWDKWTADYVNTNVYTASGNVTGNRTIGGSSTYSFGISGMTSITLSSGSGGIGINGGTGGVALQYNGSSRITAASTGVIITDPTDVALSSVSAVRINSGGSYYLSFNTASLTAGRQATFQNQSGILAYLADIQNMANTNLSLTGTRVHDLNGFDFSLQGVGNITIGNTSTSETIIAASTGGTLSRIRLSSGMVKIDGGAGQVNISAQNAGINKTQYLQAINGQLEVLPTGASTVSFVNCTGTATISGNGKMGTITLTSNVTSVSTGTSSIRVTYAVAYPTKSVAVATVEKGDPVGVNGVKSTTSTAYFDIMLNSTGTLFSGDIINYVANGY